MEIIREYYLKNGHGSVRSIQILLRKRYRWPELGRLVKKIVFECGICNRAGDLKQNTKKKAIKKERLNELWQASLIGPLKDNAVRLKYILIAIDHYTKWIEAKIINSKSANTIVAPIEKHGIPKKILADCGLEFENRILYSLYGQLNIEISYNSPYHHKTMRAVERANQSLMNKVRKLSNFGISA